MMNDSHHAPCEPLGAALVRLRAHLNGEHAPAELPAAARAALGRACAAADAGAVAPLPVRRAAAWAFVPRRPWAASAGAGLGAVALVAVVALQALLARGEFEATLGAKARHDTAAAATAAEAAAAAPFLALVSAEDLRALQADAAGPARRSEQAWLVRAELPADRLARLGLPFDPSRAGEPVRAELLVRASGELLAVRFEPRR